MNLRSFSSWLITLLLSGSILFTGTTSAQTPSKQFQIMAGFLLHFSSYVYWPNSPKKITYCVVGYNPFKGYLAQVLAARKQTKTELSLVLLEEKASLQKLKQCHVIYAQSDSYQIIWNKMRNISGTLLVGHYPEFIEQGGMVNFYQEQHRLKFEINLKSARSKGLEISSQLLTVARVRE